jgi:hypothetical protein
MCLCYFISFAQNSEVNITLSNSLNDKTDGTDIGAGLIHRPLSEYCGF